MAVNSIPKKAKEIEFRYLDDETFILHLKKSRFYKLNEIGTGIWKLINGKRTVREIADKMYEKYDVAKTKLQKDIVIFVDKGVGDGVLDKDGKKGKAPKK